MASPKKTLIGLLAGASVLALTAVTPSHADGTILSGTSGPVTIVDDTDFIEIDGTFSNDLDPGDVTNEAVVGGSTPANIGLYVDPAAIISGNLVNGVAGEIFASSAAIPTATATGVSLDGAVVDGIQNYGLIDAFASASSAISTANALGMLYGQSDTTLSLADLLNEGSIVAAAEAAASTSSNASARALSVGVSQNANTAPDAAALMQNNGDISAFADADASATSSSAFALAQATGVYQDAQADSGGGSAAVVDQTNTGTIAATANAIANATTGAVASANAYGLVQAVGGASSLIMGLSNDGSISAYASAVALSSGSAAAIATGAGLTAFGAADFGVTNNNLISARANAWSDGNASAVARGVSIVATGTATGTFENSGRIEAIASALNELGTAVVGTADATGVSIDSSGLTGEITNTGVIVAQASGQTVNAKGVTIAGVASGTFVNDGGTIEATVVDATGLARGIAIEVQDTSNAVMTLDLKGSVADGHIVGDVVIGDGDVINITEGNTYFTGEIASNGAGGDLNINTGGALWLQHGGTALGGPSVVTVANYNQASDGTVAIGVDANDPNSSRIYGDTVVLGGNMVVQMNAGLYADSVAYDDIVTSSAAIDTVWDDVSSLSPLMIAEVTYNPNDVDLLLTRVAFNDVAGLTRNQTRVATSFENAYGDPENSVAYNDVTGELFTLDAAGYAAALDDLSGIEHAVTGQQVMRSFRNMDAALAGVQGRDCESGSGSYSTSQVQGANVITPVADLDVVDCSGGSLWVRGQGLWANASNTSESPGFDETEWSIYGGADYTMSTGTTIGMMAGYVNADIDFDGGSDSGFDGYQVGVYGQQSWEAFYLQGLVAYGNMDVDVHRDIVVGDIAGTSRSNYDDAVWYLNGEMGYSWGLGLDWDATPYAGLSYANLNGDGFNESGLDGADLSGSVDGESLVSALGVRLSADWGNTTNYWRPELSLAWEHEFGDFTTLDAAFIGALASGYSVTGGDYGRDAAVVEAGFAYGFEGMEFKLNYAGRWTADYDDQAVYGQFTARF